MKNYLFLKFVSFDAILAITPFKIVIIKIAYI